MEKLRIHVIGGGRGIGRWLILNIFYTIKKVYCYDINDKSLSTLPDTIIKCLINENLSEYDTNFKQGDLFIIAVPPNILERILKQLKEQIKEESLIISVNSVQKISANLLGKYTPDHSNYLSCHPLFGSNTIKTAGQIIVFTSLNRITIQHKQFKEILNRSGIIITETDPETHDKYMGIVQAMTHFTYLTFAASLTTNNLKPSELFKLRTPNFNFLYAFTSRVLKITPTTTGSIQTTKFAQKYRELFIETAKQLHNKFKESATIEKCASIIENLREPFAGSEVDEGNEIASLAFNNQPKNKLQSIGIEDPLNNLNIGAEMAAIAVNNFQRFDEILHKYLDTPYLFIFRHRLSSKIHAVKILEIKHDEIICEESTKIIRNNGKVYYAFGVLDVARKNYQRIGLNLLKPEKKNFKKRNIKLFQTKELKDFQKKNLWPVKLVQSYKNPHQYKEVFFENWLPLLIEGLIDCEFIDTYRKKNKVAKATILLFLNPNFYFKDILEKIRVIIEENVL